MVTPRHSVRVSKVNMFIGSVKWLIMQDWQDLIRDKSQDLGLSA